MDKKSMNPAIEKLLTNIAELFKIKSLITIALFGCFIYLAVRSNVSITPELFATLITSVATYYFLRKTSTPSA